jgi:hypothetical protein
LDVSELFVQRFKPSSDTVKPGSRQAAGCEAGSFTRAMKHPKLEAAKL